MYWKPLNMLKGPISEIQGDTIVYSFTRYGRAWDIILDMEIKYF